MKRFAKGEALAAADMNQIAVAIENLQDTPRSGQHVRQGHATYGLAWFTDELQAPGVLAGVQYTSGIDAPRITDGLMELPPPGGGGGCDCVLAQYNNSSVDDVAGKLAGVQYTSGIDAPRVTDGMMALPLAEYIPTEGTTAVDGHAGGIAGVRYGGSSVDAPRIVGGVIELPGSGSSVAGLRDMYGNAVAWGDLPTADNAIILSTHYVGSYKYDLKAYRSDGFLGLQIIQDFSS